MPLDFVPLVGLMLFRKKKNFFNVYECNAYMCVSTPMLCLGEQRGH